MTFFKQHWISLVATLWLLILLYLINFVFNLAVLTWQSWLLLPLLVGFCLFLEWAAKYIQGYNPSYLRGFLYVLGSVSMYISTNISGPHTGLDWIKFWFGLVSNTCIIVRSYLDNSHEKYNPSEIIKTDISLDPPDTVQINNIVQK